MRSDAKPAKPAKPSPKPGAGGRRKPANTINFDAAERYLDNKGTDRPMTALEYKPLARQISHTLRLPTDPPPRMMTHGSGPWNAPCSNARELLAANAERGSVLVRGYRIMTVPFETDVWIGTNLGPVWKGVFHLVVAHPPKDPDRSSKWLYECATAPENDSDRGKPFLFVPSSRAHTELTDLQVLSGHWFLGLIVGGNPMFCRLVEIDNAGRGREKSMVCTTPERCIAKRRVNFFFFPNFKQWFLLKKRHMPFESMAELLGFPCADAAFQVAHSEIDFFDEANMPAALELNTNAIVDGGRRSLDLHYDSLQGLLSGQQSFDHARAMWFAHYDKLLEEMETIMSKRSEAEFGPMH